ncbi:MAG: hypothetical protein LUD72_01035, partial [Bacteroidales bacterium]|nr:hypothetical protein [Bacteroidales bacterium]
MNTQYRLQVLHSGEVFETSEKALSYIDKNLAKEVLVGEPAVAFYGDEEDPDVILCVGSAEQKVYTIDITSIKAQITALEEGSAANEQTLADAVATIEGILTAAGLIKTELKEGVEVTPDIDVKDPVIGEATSLAEAIAMLSEYAQSVAEGSQFEVEDTNSIHLEKEDGVLKAEIKVSQLGETSITADDDNIIGVFSDGVYAVAHLDYDEKSSTLTFTTSGVDENGDFKRDANVETITLGEHTEYTADNEGNTVKVEIDNVSKTIGANVQISSHENNILTEEDGKLLVKGTADNIAYADGTVADELEALENAVSKAAKATEYDDTDTISFTVTQDANDETRVSADVLLSNNNSINVSDGGLNVNLKITVNQAENTLTVKLGDVEETYDLPGVEIIDNIEFKDGNLVIHYGNGKEVTVPLEGLVAHYVFDTDEHSANSIHFDSEMDSSGVYHISANVKLRSSDNLIEHTSEGELYVSKETVEAIVSGVSDDIIERVASLEVRVTDLETANVGIVKDIEQLQKDVETNTANIQTNTDAINAIQTQMATDETSLKAIQAQVETNTSDIATNTSNITDIQNQLTTDETSLKAIQAQVETNTANISA